MIFKLNKNISIKEIKSGDIEVLCNWIMERKNKLYKICWSYLYNHDDVEDILQNSMIKAYENIKSLRKLEKFETWFISILINECKQSLKKKKREVLYEDVEVPGVYFDDYNFFQEINSIDEIFKEVIVLKYISGYSQEEISKILDIPIGTVKSRIYRGLKALKVLLKEED